MDAIVTKMEEEKERKKYIQNLLEKRKLNMDYLKRVHQYASNKHYHHNVNNNNNNIGNGNSGGEGLIHWMNVALISPSDFSEEIRKR